MKIKNLLLLTIFIIMCSLFLLSCEYTDTKEIKSIEEQTAIQKNSTIQSDLIFKKRIPADYVHEIAVNRSNGEYFLAGGEALRKYSEEDNIIGHFSTPGFYSYKIYFTRNSMLYVMGMKNHEMVIRKYYSPAGAGLTLINEWPVHVYSSEMAVTDNDRVYVYDKWHNAIFKYRAEDDQNILIAIWKGSEFDFNNVKDMEIVDKNYLYLIERNPGDSNLKKYRVIFNEMTKEAQVSLNKQYLYNITKFPPNNIFVSCNIYDSSGNFLPRIAIYDKSLNFINSHEMYPFPNKVTGSIASGASFNNYVYTIRASYEYDGYVYKYELNL